MDVTRQRINAWSNWADNHVRNINNALNISHQQQPHLQQQQQQQPLQATNMTPAQVQAERQARLQLNARRSPVSQGGTYVGSINGRMSPAPASPISPAPQRAPHGISPSHLHHSASISPVRAHDRPAHLPSVPQRPAHRPVLNANTIPVDDHQSSAPYEHDMSAAQSKGQSFYPSLHIDSAPPPPYEDSVHHSVA